MKETVTYKLTNWIFGSGLLYELMDFILFAQ